MIPKKLDFLGHSINVLQLSKEECNEACGHPLGGYNFSKLQIYINKNMPYTRKEETLLHEIMEMLLYYADGFDQDNSFNHPAFQKYASMLYAILKQNNIMVSHDCQVS